MNNQQWLDELRKELAATNLPASYRRRLELELSEHFFDFMEENMGADFSVETKMGSPSNIARTANDCHQPNRFAIMVATSAKSVAFILLPLPALVICWAMFQWLAATGCIWYFGADDSAASEFANWLLVNHLSSFHFGLTVALIAIASGVACSYGIIARRLRLGWWWILTATLQITLLMAFFFLDVKYTGIEGQNSLIFGLRVSSDMWMQIWQGIAPLVIGLWFVSRAVRYANQENNADAKLTVQ